MIINVFISLGLAAIVWMCGDEEAYLKGSHDNIAKLTPICARIFLNRTAITDQELASALTQSPTPKELTLIHCASYSGTGLPERFLTDVRRIVVWETPVGDAFYADIQRCQRLRTLMLRNTGISRKAFENCRVPYSVSNLRITNAPFTDAALHSLTDNGAIRYLALDGCAISDDGVLNSLPKLELESFSAADTTLTDRCIPGLVDCLGLRIVDVSNTQISDVGVASLLSSSSIELLNISGIEVGDGIVDAITDSKSLKILIAHKCIRERSILERIVAGSSIDKIKLRKGEFSSEHLDSLRERFPSVSIECE